MKHKLRKLLSLALSLCILAGNVLYASATVANPTIGADIAGHWAEEYLTAFIDAGYLSGDENGSVKPNSPITRAEYAALINRINGFTAESAGIANFTDVPSTAWYRGDMAKALAAEYMNGTSAVTMSPQAATTREMSIVMTARLLGLDNDDADLSALSRFGDAASVSVWAKNALAAMVSAGYIEGSGGKLNPLADMTRAEGVVMLSRTLDAMRIAIEESATPLSSFSDWADGEYTGIGTGYGGKLYVTVTIEKGEIKSVTIGQNREDPIYLSSAKKLIDKIIAGQDAKVDTVSGATLSSRGIIAAVTDALSQAAGKTEKPGESAESRASASNQGAGGSSPAGRATPSKLDYGAYYLAEGVYSGSAIGYGGTLSVDVTVSGGEIYDVTVTQTREDASYYNSAKPLLGSVEAGNSTKLDTVSGATYSSLAILAAVDDALEDAILASRAVGLGAYAKAPIERYSPALTYTLSDVEGALDTRLLYLGGDYFAVAESGANVTLSSAEKVSTGPKYVLDVTKTTTGAPLTVSVAAANDAGGEIKEDYSVQIVPYYFNSGANKVLARITFDEHTYTANGLSGENAVQFTENHAYFEQLTDSVNSQLTKTLTGKSSSVDGVSGATVSYNAFLQALTAAGYSYPTGQEPDVLKEDTTVTGEFTTGDVGLVSKAIIVNASRSLAGAVIKYAPAGGGTVTRETVADTFASKVYRNEGATFTVGESYTVKVTFPDFAFEKTLKVLDASNLYVLMNIPYTEFFAAEGLTTTTAVDAVSSPTTKFTNQYSGGAYSGNSGEFRAYLGASFSVKIRANDYVALLNNLEALRENLPEVKMYDGKGYNDELEDTTSFATTVLTELPEAYKVASKVGDAFTFSAVVGGTYTIDTAATYTPSTLAVKYGSETQYGEYELDFSPGNNNNFPVSGSGWAGEATGGRGVAGDPTVGITLSDGTKAWFQISTALLVTDANIYPLRPLENIWWGSSYGLEIGLPAGITTAHHTSFKISTAPYLSLPGETVKKVVFITDKGYYEFEWDVYLKTILTAGDYTLSVDDAVTTDGATAVTASLPAGFVPGDFKITLTEGRNVTDVTADFTVDLTAGTITWIAADAGAYTLAVSDTSGAYAGVTAEFTII